MEPSVYKSIVYPPEANFETIVYVDQMFQTDNTDVVISGYPKSGKTWLLSMLYWLRNGGTSLPGAKVNFHDDILKLEFNSVNEIKGEMFPSPRLIFTHFKIGDVLKYNGGTKYIYLARNPRDVVTAYYNSDYKIQQPSFDEFFQEFIQNQVYYGSWFDHVGSIYNFKDRPNVVIITFESLFNNTERQLKTIANFLGGQYKVHAADQDVIANTLRKNSFQSTSGLEDGNGTDLLSDQQAKQLEMTIRERLGSDRFQFWISKRDFLIDKFHYSQLTQWNINKRCVFCAFSWTLSLNLHHTSIWVPR